jgi:hypothetical protein
LAALSQTIPDSRLGGSNVARKAVLKPKPGDEFAVKRLQKLRPK